MKRILLNAVFTLVVFFVFLLSLELVLRTTHLFGARISWSTPDPVIGWRFTPGQKYWCLDENDHPITESVNRYGWNDREWAVEKPAGTYRVAVIGDSYVEALQVERAKHFITLAEKQLNASGGERFELMNFGRSGFTQSEEWIILQSDVARFSPDMVVLFFFPPNDIMDVHPETAIDPIRPYFMPAPNGAWVLDTSFKDLPSFRMKSRISFFKHHSALVSLLAERYSLYTLKRIAVQRKLLAPDRTAIVPDRLAGYLSLASAHPDPAYVRNYNRWNKEIIKRMADFCRRRGIRMVLVSIDTPDYIPGVEERFKKWDPTFKPDFFDEDLKEFAGRNGMGFLGLGRIFRLGYERSGEFSHWGDWRRPNPKKYSDYLGHSGHWNYRGHELVAGALAGEIDELVKGEPAK